MWARAVSWACIVGGCLSAAAPGTLVAGFDGPNPLAGWSLARYREFPAADGSLALGPGRDGQAAVLQYRFPCGAAVRCGGALAAAWSPPKPLAVRKKGALSLWIRAAPEVRVTIVVSDKDEGVRRYPIEVASLENPSGDWHLAVIPFAAKSTGYFDQDHNGPPTGRVTAISLVVEARFAQALSGSVAFDDLRLLDSPDQSFSLDAGAPLLPPPPASAHLAPRLGVNIHRLFDLSALDRARDAGFAFVRADLLWRQAERNGAFRFAAYDRLLAALESRAMGALWILDYGHPDHGGDTPRTAQDIAAFARFAQEAAAHFKGRNVRYEVWNEPDTERFWPPAPRPEAFAPLLREAVAAIHRADPAARVSSGGLSRMDLPFLAAAVAAGGAPALDAVALHPYRKAGPEGLASDWTAFRQWITAHLGNQVELWDTEWGYASYDYFSQNLRGDGHSPAGRERQAVLAAREALTIWGLGLPLAVWYDLRDDGDDPKNPEHNYGLLDSQNAPKPAMLALLALNTLARGHTFAGMVRQLPDGAHAMRFDGPDTVFALWDEQPDAKITVRLPAAASVSNIAGEPLKTKASHGRQELVLAETLGPVYLRFPAR